MKTANSGRAGCPQPAAAGAVRTPRPTHFRGKLHTLVLFVSVSGLLLSSRLPAPTAPASPADITAMVREAVTYESGKSVQSLRQLEALGRQSATQPALRKELEAGLIQLLAPPATPEARLFACQQLAIIGSEASLPALADLLKNNDTVGAACLALTTHPSPKVNAILRQALLAASGVARVQIINLLGDRQDKDAVKMLAGLTGDRDETVAQAATASLGKIASPAACDNLAKLRKDTNPDRVRLAVQASLAAADRLATSGDRQAAATIYTDLLHAAQPNYVRRAALEGLLRVDRDGGEQRILEVLRGSDGVLIPSAIAGISAPKSRGASARFASELAKLNPPHQVLLIDALARRADAAAQSAIVANVAANDPAVRRAALAALGRIGDASTVPILVPALAAAHSPEEHQAAELALARLGGGAKTDEALIAALQQTATEAKPKIIAVLSRRGSRAAVPALLAAADDPALARAAFQALAKLAGPEHLAALLDKLVNLKVPAARAAAEIAAAQALAQVPEAAVRSEAVYVALARATEVEARCSILGLLPAIAGPAALAALKTAQADPEERVRDAAIRALAEWPNVNAWDALMGIYRQPSGEAHRVIALRALVRLAREENARPAPALIERYRNLLAGARDDQDRKLILGALGGAAHPDALPLALPLLANPGVRAEAELAVKQLAEAIKAQHPQAAQEALSKLK